jgi:adhesin transport system outer membrane protein
LLNSQNQYFNAQVSLVSSRGVAVFADYQLLAAMGKMLSYLKTATPPEADELTFKPFGAFPLRVAPIILTAPAPGSEPLNTGVNPGAVNIWPNNPFFSPREPQLVTFGERWTQEQSGVVALGRQYTAGQFNGANASADRPANSQ